MANKTTAPEPWFERRIRRGLAALMTLRMDGHPPADTVEATAKVWAQALWPGRVCAVNSCIAELRANGYAIACRRVGRERFEYRMEVA